MVLIILPLVAAVVGTPTISYGSWRLGRRLTRRVKHWLYRRRRRVNARVIVRTFMDAPRESYDSVDAENLEATAVPTVEEDDTSDYVSEPSTARALRDHSLLLIKDRVHERESDITSSQNQTPIGGVEHAPLGHEGRLYSPAQKPRVGVPAYLGNKPVVRLLVAEARVKFGLLNPKVASNKEVVRRFISGSKLIQELNVRLCNQPRIISWSVLIYFLPTKEDIEIATAYTHPDAVHLFGLLDLPTQA